ncbi:Bug family tripartite tricarboxylate transporter substrate binding protein [Pigmentiphaga kullae]|uniref:Tripartite-type tricarboxylate transporter receptor subunit TctC n=1 Tax=Pigmentiphaga kullae TaxID=151784 RepID=A0A4V2F2G8_9BURK|nr:tripartite tricarboxylate transporter substrate binding protein [Pigmentiphaga kullae]RZS78098.1 tripartite-type tricarboxylate transporter receptor subunit TctC [Pigmentiphaga kullae]
MTTRAMAAHASGLLLTLAGLTLHGAAQAQDEARTFPEKSVRWVIPFPAGGATDVVARMVAQKLTDQWGQPVVVENRAGATGSIGSQYVAAAAADGYTLLMGTASTHAVAPAVNANLPYKNLADFTPITLVATFPNLLVVHPSLPVHSVADLIALLKAHPDRYNFASTGTGGSVHMAGELFKLKTSTRMTHVPYKGSSEALADLLSGRVQVEFDNMTTVWPLAQKGRLRALGVTSLKRTPLAPDLPAIAETVPDFDAPSWVGIFAPARTPAAIVQKIAASVSQVMQQPDVIKKLHELGATPVTDSPAAFAAFVEHDTERWRDVAAKAGIRLE